MPLNGTQEAVLYAFNDVKRAQDAENDHREIYSLAQHATERQHEKLWAQVEDYLAKTGLANHRYSAVQLTMLNRYETAQGEGHGHASWVILPQDFAKRHKPTGAVRMRESRLLVLYDNGMAYDAEGFGDSEATAWASFITNSAISDAADSQFPEHL